jgi:adenylate cyclase
MAVQVPWRISSGNRRAFLAGIALVVFVVLAALSHQTPWRLLELRAYDVLSTINVPAVQEEAPIIVAIDEPSLAELNRQWPWPRDVHARLVESLRAAGTKAIALDIVFADPSNPDADAALASAMAADVVLAADETLLSSQHAEQLIRVMPLPALTDAGAKPGLAAISLDGDGALRRMPLYPDGFAAELLRSSGHDVQNVPHGLVQVFGPGRTLPTVSYYQALDPDEFLPENFFRGRTVIVGLSLQNAPTVAAGGADAYATSATWHTGRLVAGAEIHATLYENLRLGLLVTPASEFLRLAVLGLAVLAAMWAVWRSSSWHTIAAAAATLALATIGSYLLVRFGRVFVPPLAPTIAFALVAASQAAWDYASESRQRRDIVRAFSQYLSPVLVDRLARDPSQLKLGGEKRTLTILFADVRGFTSIAEKMKDDPQGLTALINRLLDPLSRIVLEEGGTIDKYIGDCIMAFWNAPLDEPDHAAKAVTAGLRMQGAIDTLNEELASEAAEGDTPVRIGIGVGINTGECVVGNMGSQMRFDYSAIGDAVNLTSRLEGKTRDYDAPVIIGPDTARLVLDRFDVRELDRIAVKGRTETVPIYAVKTRETEALLAKS